VEKIAPLEKMLHITNDDRKTKTLAKPSYCTTLWCLVYTWVVYLMLYQWTALLKQLDGEHEML
jgi:hypothetical protein